MTDDEARKLRGEALLAMLGDGWQPAGACPFCGELVFSNPWRGVAHCSEPKCGPFIKAVLGLPTVEAQLASIDSFRN